MLHCESVKLHIKYINCEFSDSTVKNIAQNWIEKYNFTPCRLKKLKKIGIVKTIIKTKSNRKTTTKYKTKQKMMNLKNHLLNKTRIRSHTHTHGWSNSTKKITEITSNFYFNLVSHFSFCFPFLLWQTT